MIPVRCLSRLAGPSIRSWQCRQLSFLARSLPQKASLWRTAASAAAVQSIPIPNHPDMPHDELPIASPDDKQVAVGWDTKTWSRFHHIWLRDHCRCPQCFHPVTKQRLVDTFEIPADIKPIHVESNSNGLEVHWPSQPPHVSVYPWKWLRHTSYDPPMKETTNDKILWGSKIQQSPPIVAYDEVMNPDDRGLFKWLSNVDRFGFSFVSGVPATVEATEELSTRIAFIRETQYGKFWEFTSDLSKGDTAYTNMALSAHTDNTYFTDPCGLQLFHLLSHTDGTGGSTLLVDGFYVASILKELHPEAYALLSNVPIPAHAAGESTSLYRPYPTSGYPVLGHDSITGELSQVRWNNDDRSAISHLEPHEVEGWYDAIRLWNKSLRSADSEYWIQLAPGMAVIIDNHRVLHGRSSFTGKRRMCGAYIGGDEYRSKLAVLSEQFADPPATAERDSDVDPRSVWSPFL